MPGTGAAPLSEVYVASWCSLFCCTVFRHSDLVNTIFGSGWSPSHGTSQSSPDPPSSSGCLKPVAFVHSLCLQVTKAKDSSLWRSPPSLWNTAKSQHSHSAKNWATRKFSTFFRKYTPASANFCGRVHVSTTGSNNFFKVLCIHGNCYTRVE